MLPIPFNNPYTYPGHSGVDFPQPRGTPFRASGPGYVSSIDYGPRPGHTVWVKYDYGPNVGYCHMDRRTTYVERWQRVDEGTVLGEVGALGTFSTGPHLHVEIAGHATTAGFWRYFTRDRVVGDGAPAGGGAPVDITPPIPDLPEEEEDTMHPRQIHAVINGRIHRALLVPGTSYFVKWTESENKYANSLARNMETGDSTEVTASLFGVFEREALALRPRDALSIELAEAS